ncbi:nitroreductase/quinone reductase family protein [Nocardia sp. NPDC048505]|uniref:nitroreductase/quinone reductase family protein n=1 Tax=unclassified Nocardia TaxID=2637762 RepID=UPI0034011054
MPSKDDIQHRVVTTLQRRIWNPLIRRVPAQQLLETTGRVSGQPRVTPIGGRRVGREFWLVSEYGERSQYIRNIKADNRVRLRDRGRWYTGTAHLLPADDARARLRSLPRYNSTMVRLVGTDMLTVRIDLDA